MGVRTLVAIRDSPYVAPADRIRCIELLFERGFGKPVQTVNHRVIHSVADLSDDELAALLASDPDGPRTIEGKAE